MRTDIEKAGFTEILEQKEEELIQVLRRRDGIVIEKSADQMDEIQFASERDLAIRNVDRETAQLREVKSALRRVRTGDFGICTECEAEINAKRLTAMPWAPRCIRCQEAEERDGAGAAESIMDPLADAA